MEPKSTVKVQGYPGVNKKLKLQIPPGRARADFASAQSLDFARAARGRTGAIPKKGQDFSRPRADGPPKTKSNVPALFVWSAQEPRKV